MSGSGSLIAQHVEAVEVRQLVVEQDEVDARREALEGAAAVAASTTRSRPPRAARRATSGSAARRRRRGSSASSQLVSVRVR